MVIILISINESKLNLLAKWQANESERQVVEARNMTIWKANWMWRWQIDVSEYHLVGVCKPSSFTESERGQWGTKGKRQKGRNRPWVNKWKVLQACKTSQERDSLWKWCELVSPFLLSFTSRQDQIISLWVDQRHFSLQSGRGVMSSEAGYYKWS